MVQSRNNPTASEWTAIRREFRELYLNQNMKLNDVKESMYRTHGFVASDRQYKMRVKSWKLDRKKIKGPTWHSMFIVMKHRSARGISSTFRVPIRGNHIEVVRSDRITKQINRDRTVFDPTNLKRAEEILREEGVEVYTVEEERAMARDRPTQASDPSQGFNFNDDPSVQWQGSSVVNDSAGEGSSSRVSPQLEGMLPTTAVAGTAEASTEFRPTAHLHAPAPTVSMSASYPTNSHRGSSSWDPSGPTSTAAAFQNPTWTFDADALMNSFSDPSCTTQLYARDIHHSNGGDSEEEKRRAVMWVGPYIQLYIRCEPIMADWFRESREVAKSTFNEMLRTNNKYTFPYCNWMVTVLASNEQTTLLTLFLMDCCEVIDQFCTDLQGTHGAVFHLLLALYTQGQENIEECQEAFEFATQRIGMIWGRTDPNYLVHYCTLAWLMLEKSRHEEALARLRQYLPILENTMGSQHVVTLNYFTVYARALAETGCEREAIMVLKDVCDRLNGCTDLLQGYRYRQLMRLAELQIETNDFGAAEANLVAIIHFRTHHFGMGAACTWKTIETYRDFLRNQQRFDEADFLWNQNLQRYQEEMASK